MSGFKSSQILMLSLVAALLFLTPFLSTAARSPYIYFVINFLIISLGAQAGLLSALSNNSSDNDFQKQADATADPITKISFQASTIGNGDKDATSSKPDMFMKMFKKTVSEKVSSVVVVVPDTVMLKKCPSSPCIFFIGDQEGNIEVKEEGRRYHEKLEEAEEEEEEISGQELFAKAEAFIGNFYMQLKMQREEEIAWNKLHGL